MLASAELPPDVVLEDASCPLGCKSDDEQVLVSTDRISGIGGLFRVVRCRSCGLSRTSPRPTRETIGNYYPDEYAPYQYTKGSGQQRQRSMMRALGRKVIDFNADHLPPTTGKHALEIGCASGAYMSYLASLGFSVEGVELNAAAAASARERGFHVQTSLVEGMRPPQNTPSLVVAWMVLEHLHDPVGALQRFRDWAAPDARLVASVPNFANGGIGVFGSNWYPLHLPCHLFHYNEDSLRQLLAHGGWQLERVFYHRTVGDFVASAGNWAETKGSSRLAERLRTLAKQRKFHLAMYPLAAGLAAVGQTGRMTVWARRA